MVQKVSLRRLFRRVLRVLRTLVHVHEIAEDITEIAIALFTEVVLCSKGGSKHGCWEILTRLAILLVIKELVHKLLKHDGETSLVHSV